MHSRVAKDVGSYGQEMYTSVPAFVFGHDKTPEASTVPTFSLGQ